MVTEASVHNWGYAWVLWTRDYVNPRSMTPAKCQICKPHRVAFAYGYDALEACSPTYLRVGGQASCAPTHLWLRCNQEQTVGT